MRLCDKPLVKSLTSFEAAAAKNEFVSLEVAHATFSTLC